MDFLVKIIKIVIYGNNLKVDYKNKENNCNCLRYRSDSIRELN